MKRVFNRKLFTLILAAALVLALTGCGSGSKTTKAAAPKVRFDDTEIMRSPLLETRGDRWAVMGSMDYMTRDELLGCDLSLRDNGTSKYHYNAPMMQLILFTTPAPTEADVHPDTLTALRVTIGRTCYAFNYVDMRDNGFGCIPCGDTARQMLADLADCERATFEVDYVQYGSGREGTFTADFTRARLSQWRQMAGLLERSNIWDVLDGVSVISNDASTSITRL